MLFKKIKKVIQNHIFELISQTKSSKFKYLFNFYIRVMTKDDFNLRCELSNNLYKFNDSTGEIYLTQPKRSAYLLGSIEHRVNKLFEEYMLDQINFEDNDIVVDCGANIGELYLSIKKKVNNSFNYFGFEPSEKDFKALKLNTKNLVKSNYALFDRNEIKVIYLNEEKDTSYLPFVYDSHDVVAYLMIMMNHLCARDMGTHKNGIYRSILMKEESIGTVPEKIRTFISLLRNSTGSKYVLYNKEIGHAILNLNEYVQITSPIRRLVDLLNMICFQDNHSITKWKHLRDKENFYNGWLERLDYVNDVMKQIKKAQNDCNALHICLTSPEILENFYDGYIIEREENESKDLFQYSVYLNEHKMIVKMKSMEKYEIYSEHKFKIFVFQDENSLKQKIRVQLF